MPLCLPQSLYRVVPPKDSMPYNQKVERRLAPNWEELWHHPGYCDLTSAPRGFAGPLLNVRLEPLGHAQHHLIAPGHHPQRKWLCHSSTRPHQLWPNRPSRSSPSSLFLRPCFCSEAPLHPCSDSSCPPVPSAPSQNPRLLSISEFPGISRGK